MQNIKFAKPNFRGSSKEALNKSASAEQRIFCPICSVLKMGNTQSIPTFSEPSAESKSSAVFLCQFNQSFPSGRILDANINFWVGGGTCYITVNDELAKEQPDIVLQ